MKITNKNILIISPQDWGKMRVSKHHYAIELAKLNNKVFYLNPISGTGDFIKIIESNEQKNLKLIEHGTKIPLWLKFKFNHLYHLLIKAHIHNIIKKIDVDIDIVWSFDLGNYYPFNYFPKSSIKIFHPVDEPSNETAINSAKGAQFIFSVTNEILLKYKNFNIPSFFINHGVSEDFQCDNISNYTINDPIRIGFSGNLTRADIDWPIFAKIIEENPGIIFECWGAYMQEQSNIAGNLNNDVKSYIQKIKSYNNVILHGPIETKRLCYEYGRMDGFLICYDILRDQSKGTNYHKIMEFLSTGRVIISNNVTTYQNYPGLIEMLNERTNNDNLPDLFKKVVSDLNLYNSPQKIIYRKNFAMKNTYMEQINNIGHHLAT